MRVSSRRIALACGSFVTGLFLAFLWIREPLGTLTLEGLAAARSKWTAAGVRNYRLHYRMHGADYEIEVTDSVVVRALVNGIAPRTPDWQVFGVEGLFDILDQELDLAAGPRGTGILQRVRFHDRYGYVERYLRTGMGTLRGAEIEVLELARP